MQAQNNGNRQGPLVFDFSPREFRGLKGVTSFKFVYLRQTDQLIIGHYDMKHREIAEEAFGRKFGMNEAIGAILSYEGKINIMRFKLYGKSGYFGDPEKAQLRRVADHITARLDSAIITEGEHEIVIEGEFA